MRYGIGLDIGIASVGYAALALNELDEPCGIIRMGVRTFDAAERPKDGASLAAPRRLARGQSRRIRRHRHRLERIRALLVSSGVLTQAQLDKIHTGKALEDIYALRVKALDFPLTAEQFARVLIHLAQRRGFKSNRKADSTDKESGKLLSAVDENLRRMERGAYRTVGEMFLKDEAFAQHKRNKGEAYLATVSRALVQEEAALIFSKQRAFGQAFASDEVEAAYLDILLGQRSFDEGPGGNSPYGGNQIERMRGECQFVEGEKRAAKASYSFERFRLLQKINHLRLNKEGEIRALTQAERKTIIELAHKTERLSYAAVRKALILEEETRFVGLDYRQDEKKDPESGRFESLPAFHAIRKALDKLEKGMIKQIPPETLDAIGETLSLYKNEKTLREELKKLSLDEKQVDALLDIPAFSKFGHLSLKALRRLMPHLEEGLTYDAACERAGFDFRSHEAKPERYLLSDAPEMAQITSPVVRRAVAQTIKVVNAIIREQGESPVYVKIELAREMSRDFKERREMAREMEENASRNEKIMEQLRNELGVPSPTGLDLVKLKLYHQQQGRSPYSLAAFDLNRLFERGYAEIDHIIPYSICFDDSYNNKALVFSHENQNKGNRLPLEYLQGEQRERFIVHTKTAAYPPRKRAHLLKERISLEDRECYKERNLQDTKHMSRFLYNYINDRLLFASSLTGRKKRVTAVNGRITAHLRKRWGLSKFRDEGDLHHAMDAVVIACATDGMIQQISRFYGDDGSEYLMLPDGASSAHRGSGEIFPLPWPGFREDITFRLGSDPAERLSNLRDRHRLPSYEGLPAELIDRARPIFVSRMPRRKVSGPAHMETIKGKHPEAEDMVTKRVPLKELKLDSQGEIAGYFRPNDDRLLYEMLRQRLRDSGNNAARAFAEPVFKPDRQGNPKQPVKKVRIAEKSTLTVPVHNGTGVAKNVSMVRIDVFYIEGDGHYFVPIYVADTIRPQLPNRACVANKPYSEWKEMDDQNFLFSLYPNDIIKIQSKDGLKLKINRETSALPGEREALADELLYYKEVNISVGQIKGCSHDNAYVFDKGIKQLVRIKKYQTDVLGNVSRVSQERRMPFTLKG